MTYVPGLKLGLKWGGPRRQTSPFRLADPNSLGNIPPWTDARPGMHVGHGYEVFNQGDEGSCVGNGGSAVGFTALVRSGETDLFIPSRQGLYDMAALLDGTWGSDEGTTISQMLNVFTKYGFWPENKPGDPANEPYPGTFKRIKPSPESLAYGQKHQGLIEAHVAQNACMIKAVLAQGVPVILGWQVYDEDMEIAGNASKGIMPRNPKGSLQGGHCGVLFGYNDTDQPQAAPGFEHAPIPAGYMGNLNSWGPNTGDHGYLWFPQSRVLSSDYFDDFGALQTAEIG